MQRTLSISNNHLDSCRRQGIPTTGNAAGNSKNFLNLTGAPTTPEKNPMGALIDASSLGAPSKHVEFWPPRKHWAPWMPAAPSYP